MDEQELLKIRDDRKMITRRGFLSLPAVASLASLPLSGKAGSDNYPVLQAVAGKARLTPDDYPETKVWTYGGSCLLYTSPSPRDGLLSRMPSSA